MKKRPVSDWNNGKALLTSSPQHFRDLFNGLRKDHLSRFPSIDSEPPSVIYGSLQICTRKVKKSGF